MDKYEIEDALKDYHWMINTVKMVRESLRDAGEGLTAQYGIEAVMPKASGSFSDPIFREVTRREKRWRKITDYERKINTIQERMHMVTTDREIEVLHWLLEGKSMRWIGKHMGLSHTNIQNIKNQIINKMSE